MTDQSDRATTVKIRWETLIFMTTAWYRTVENDVKENLMK